MRTSARIFEDRHLWRMTAEAYRKATELLATAAVARFGAPSLVVGIANGGRAPAYAIGAQTGGAVVIAAATHNTTDQIRTQATGHVACYVNPLAGRTDVGGPVLVVDDICGSGATLSAVIQALGPHLNTDAVIGTATLCRNAGAPDGVPDLYVWDVADWVVFPWEQPPSGEGLRWLPMPTEVRAS